MCCGSTRYWPTGNAGPCSARAATSSGCARHGGTATPSSPRCWAVRAGTRSPPSDRFVWGGFYEEGSMIWRSRWVTNHGIIECREALAFPGEPHRAVLLRRVIAVDGDSQGPDHPGPTGRFRPARPHPPARRGRHLDRPQRPAAPAVDRAPASARPGRPARRTDRGPAACPPAGTTTSSWRSATRRSPTSRRTRTPPGRPPRPPGLQLFPGWTTAWNRGMPGGPTPCCAG